MINQLESTLEQTFKWLHSHPELALEEFKTTAYIKSFMQKHGIELLDMPLETGVLAIIRGAEAQPVIAMRADIDALPIQEQTDLAWRSEHPGVMHACGHDFHTASLLGAALLLKQRAHLLKGTVKLLFQPAEEAADGARRVIETGLLADVDMIFAMHVKPDGKAGVVYAKDGAEHAAVDKFTVCLKAEGGHAAAPHTTPDTIVAASALVQALQSIVSRGIDPLASAVVSVTRITAGNTWNVLPSQAELEGTVRTFGADVRKMIEQRFRATVQGVAAIYGVQPDIRWEHGVPATNNDYVLVEMLKNTALSLGLTVRPAVPSMGGEDFSLYQKQMVGVMWELGIGCPYPLHHSRFSVDPSLLADSARLMAEVACTALE